MERGVLGVARAALATTIINSTDSSGPVQQLISMDIPLHTKFDVLDFCELLKHNGQSVDGLKKLIMALNILEKYGRHLLKPPDARSNMWRHIKFNNSIFRDRVDTIQDGRDIMKQLGYSQTKADGVAFPDGVEPDHDRVLHVVVDILLSKKELEVYLGGVHPHPAAIEGFLHPELVEILSRSSANATSQPQTADRPSTDRPATDRPPSIQPPVSQSPASINKGQEVTGHNTATGSATLDLPTKESASMPVPVIGEPVGSREPAPAISPILTCDICGANDADVICQMCDNKQLCNDCDVKWHKHPKRQNHNTRQLVGPQMVGQGDLGQAPPGTQLPPPTPCRGKALDTGSGHSTSSSGQGGRSMPQLAPTMYYSDSRRPPTPGYTLQQPPYGAADPMFYSRGEMDQVQPPMANIPGNDGSRQWAAHYPGRGQRPASGHFPGPLPRQPLYSMMPQYRAPQDTRHSMPPYMPQQQYPAPYIQTSVQMFPLQPPEAGRYVYGRLGSQGSQTSGSSGHVPVSPATASSTEYPYSGLTDPGYRSATPNTNREPSFPWTPGSLKPDPDERSESKLLPRIKSIPDLQQRKARVDVSLMTLQDDVVDWDKQINAIILRNPNFFVDETYKALNQKKRNHLQEIEELDAYRCQLENSENCSRVLDGPTHEAQTPRPGDSPVMYQPYIQVYPGGPGLPPGPMGHGMAVAATGQGIPMPRHLPAPVVTPGMGPNPPGSNVYYHPVSQSAEIDRHNTPVSGWNNDIDDDEQRRLEDVRRLLVLDQTPFQTKKKEKDKKEMKLNIPVNDLGRDQRGLTINEPSDIVAYPPALADIITPPPAVDVTTSQANIPPAATGDVHTPASGKVSNVSGPPIMTSAKHVLSTPNLSDQPREPATLRKYKSSSDVVHWACEHCTYENTMDSRVCAVCSKTSDNPQILGVPPTMAAEGEPRLDISSGEPCQFCTYRNPPGTKVCGMCKRTQTAPAAGHDVSPAPVGGAPDPATQPPVMTEAGSLGIAAGLEKLLTEEQDQVLLEKKQAWAAFERKNRAGGSVPSADIEGPGGGGGAQELPTEAQAMDTEKSAPSCPTTKSVQRLRQPSDHGPSSDSSGSYSSAHSSLGHFQEAGRSDGAGPGIVGLGPGTVPGAEGEATLEDKKTILPSNFAEAIERINLVRAQEQMDVDGRDFVSLIKVAEKAGFSMAEVEIAVERSIEHRADPLDWLADDWTQMVDLVVVKAMGAGDQGEVTVEEAKAALIETKGNIDEATGRCVSQRRDVEVYMRFMDLRKVMFTDEHHFSKYADLSGRGMYGREEILAALHQHAGALGPALNQLDGGLLHDYVERLWSTVYPGAGASPDPVMAEVNTSVANIVVEMDDFQLVVRDLRIDNERRIRMIFVEGKLKSWGRAATVISILDTHVTGAGGAAGAAPLECSLEDIIEAVRNCGDKKSSLVYLQQECGICYALYPMTKMRSLACTCKLCMGCVKQNFEVVIRERYVRNWGCPLCDAPRLEDEEAASQYFELLQLILQSLVDEEIMDLFDTKLRDWHLQKDPNFRWCAHCAAGFLWERPNVLAMACQACHQKTCFLCKRKWEDQHEGVSCDKFQQWQIENDTDTQAAGLARHLQENGIDCPSCKMRYALAKGGCMHFTCPECGHEFCSGCSQPFFKPGVCTLWKSCPGKGLHCHHPRDCFYYLRDNSYTDLQKLLQTHDVEYNTEPPGRQADKAHCPVMEQKEHGSARKDELCGVDTGRGMAGLCESHYKEYLVGLLNRNKIDPVAIMGVGDVKILLQRGDIAAPDLQRGEGEHQYRKRLHQFAQEKIPLRR